MTKEEIIKDLEEIDLTQTDAGIYYDLFLVANRYHWHFKDDRLLNLVWGYTAEDIILQKIYNMIHPEETNEETGEVYRDEEENWGCDLQDILDYIHKLVEQKETDCHNAVYLCDSYGVWSRVPHEELIKVKDKMMAILKEEN